jgi:hypothetical protein
MDLINNTSFPHLLFRTSIEVKDYIAASINVRVTYDIENGKLKVSTEQSWPISASPIKSDYGTLAGDFVFNRGGVDVFIFGKAIAPGNVPTQKMLVSVFIKGKINHSVIVYGNRFWESGILGLSISTPEPFMEMPLTLENAFGGYDEWDGLQIPCPSNPFGKGFIWKKETAKGKALPNIENPNKLISSWKDKPSPTGFVPTSFCEDRIMKSTNPAEKIEKFFNTAFYPMIASELKTGEIIKITGVTSQGEFVIEIPPMAAELTLQFGDKHFTRQFYIDQIGIEPQKNKAFITYKYAFNYQIRPHEQRILTINRI